MKIFSSILSVIKSILGFKSTPATPATPTAPVGDASTGAALLADAEKAASDVVGAAGEVVNVLDQAVHLVFPDGVTADLMQDLITLVQKATGDAKAAGTAAPSMAVLQPGQTIAVITPSAIVADVKEAAASVETFAKKIEGEVVAEAKKVIGDVETFFTHDTPAPAATEPVAPAPVVAPVAAKELEPAPVAPAPVAPAPVVTPVVPPLTSTAPVAALEVLAPEPVTPTTPTLDDIDANASSALETETDSATIDALLDVRAAVAKAKFHKSKAAAAAVK